MTFGAETGYTVVSSVVSHRQAACPHTSIYSYFLSEICNPCPFIVRLNHCDSLFAGLFVLFFFFKKKGKAPPSLMGYMSNHVTYSYFTFDTSERPDVSVVII